MPPGLTRWSTSRSDRSPWSSHRTVVIGIARGSTSTRTAGSNHDRRVADPAVARPADPVRLRHHAGVGTRRRPVLRRTVATDRARPHPPHHRAPRPRLPRTRLHRGSVRPGPPHRALRRRRQHRHAEPDLLVPTPPPPAPQGQLGITGNADDPDGVAFTDSRGSPIPQAHPPNPPTEPMRCERPYTAPPPGRMNYDWVGLGWVHPDELQRRRQRPNT